MTAARRLLAALAGVVAKAFYVLLAWWRTDAKPNVPRQAGAKEASDG